MKLSISNIGWTSDKDLQIYKLMQKYGYTGLEIAPTRIFPENPYMDLTAVRKWREEICTSYGFQISSMQSIWYGRQEHVFGTEEERQILIDYTKKAIEFASLIGCKNLVFGCPRNRVLPDGIDAQIAIPFFKELGDYAYSCKTVIAMEANPPIYNTNYINTTSAALELVQQVDSKGFMLNLDTGTMIENGEAIDVLRGGISFINHVHISEPGLKPIQKQRLHYELLEVLNDEKYNNYISIEMGKQEDSAIIEEKMKYIRGVFG